jgi:hypothetical protein
MKVEVGTENCSYESPLYSMKLAEYGPENAVGLTKFTPPSPPPVPKKIEFIKEIDEDKDVKSKPNRPVVPTTPTNTDLNWVKIKKDSGVRVKVTSKDEKKTENKEKTADSTQELKAKKKVDSQAVSLAAGVSLLLIILY